MIRAMTGHLQIICLILFVTAFFLEIGLLETSPTMASANDDAKALGVSDVNVELSAGTSASTTSGVKTKRNLDVSRDVRLLTVSWNVGNAETNPQQYHHMIPSNGEGYDLIVVGLQESTYVIGADPNLEPTAPSDSHKVENDDPTLLACIIQFKQLLIEHIGKEFYLVAHNVRAQMQLFVFARTELRDYISKIEMCAENTGFMHVFPNKGGLSVCFALDSTNLAFFSSHLAAHEGVFNCYMRNSSVKEIMEGTVAGPNKDLDVPSQFHHVFFMGDMNYRLTMNPEDEPNDTYEETKKKLVEAKAKEKEEKKAAKEAAKLAGKENVSNKLKDGDEGAVETTEVLSPDKQQERRANHEKILGWIKDENFEMLMAHDEVLREVRQGRLLPGFTPCPVAFAPTFKRYRGGKKIPTAGGEVSRCIAGAVVGPNHKHSREYDLSPSSASTPGTTATNCVDYYYNPQRYPAFTDRVLYKSLPAFEKNLEFVHFDSSEFVDTSDHKPVHAGFVIKTQRAGQALRVNMDGKVVKTISFRLNNLKCFDLSELDLAAFGGGSDPYIVLSTDPMELYYPTKTSKIQSSCITHDLNPVWLPEETLEISLVSNDVKGLSDHAHLMIQVWDKDTYTQNDMIGTAVVPMKALLEGTTTSVRDGTAKEYKLSEQLYHAGAKQGRIECTVTRVPDILPPPPTRTNSFGRESKIARSQPSFVRKNLSMDEYIRQKSLKKVGMTCNCVVC